MISQLRSTLTRYVSLRRVAGLYRRRLSQKIFSQCGGVIQHGIFEGMRWLDDLGWGFSDQGVMILGLYEQEVQESLRSVPERYRVFVDVGAADGYYAVGLLHCGRMSRTIAFEMLPAAREAIARLAQLNNVRDRITILGAASEDFSTTLLAQNIDPAECLFLFDIEGAEFHLLTEELFQYLSHSILIVEMHAHNYPDPQAETTELIRRSAGTHRPTLWTSGARNPWTLSELDEYTELDRWMLCSEGRKEVQNWLRFDPI